jgi:hypothetical protein
MTDRLLFFLLAFLICSCEPHSYLPMDQLKSYPLNKENGLYQSAQVGAILIEVIYRPKDLIIAQEVDVINDDTQWVAQERRLDSVDYFVLRLSRSGDEIENMYAGREARYQQVISYLSGGIGSDLSLKRGNETIEIEGLAFAPTFGGSNASSVLMIFKSYLSKVERDFSVEFNDSQFGTGLNSFRFKAKAIGSCPKLRRH